VGKVFKSIHLCLQTKNQNMKKFVYLLGTVAISLVVSCGPSAEEKAAAEKHIADSIAAVEEARIQDSLMAVETAHQDSIAAAAQVAADSLRNLAIADSIAAASKKANAPKPKPKKTQEQIKIEKEIKEVKDATRGRG
jgi:hypothetical protein